MKRMKQVCTPSTNSIDQATISRPRPKYHPCILPVINNSTQISTTMMDINQLDGCQPTQWMSTKIDIPRNVFICVSTLLQSSSVETLMSSAIGRIVERSRKDETRRESEGGRGGYRVSCVSVGRYSDGRGSSRRALPRIPHRCVESHGRVVVSPEAVASQHRHRLRWNLRCVHSDRHEVGQVGAATFDACQACAISNVV